MKTPDVLDRLWEDISPTDPPIADLLNAGRTAARHKRRRVVAGGAALAVLVTAGGILAAREIPDQGGDPTVASTGARDLTVQVESDVSPAVTARYDASVGYDAAIWDPEQQRLFYVSRMDYSGSCPPDASAKLTDAGTVVLEIRPYAGAGACTADATRVTVNVDGLTEAPIELTVEAFGAARVLWVQGAPGNGEVFALDCPQTDSHVGTFPDYLGTPEGSPTPLQAVAPMLADDESAAVDGEDPVFNTIRAALLRADGTTRAVVALGRGSGGWYVASADSCTGDLVRPRRR